MIQPRKLSEREPILFILLFVLMVVLLWGGRAKRQAYDAGQARLAQMDLKTSAASKHDHLPSAAAVTKE